MTIVDYTIIFAFTAPTSDKATTSAIKSKVLLTLTSVKIFRSQPAFAYPLSDYSPISDVLQQPL